MMIIMNMIMMMMVMMMMIIIIIIIIIILCDILIKKDREIKANRSDIDIKNKKERSCLLTEIYPSPLKTTLQLK